MNKHWKFLIIGDNSPEFPAAALYAGLRARVTHGEVVLLCVIEGSAHTHWLAVGDELRREAWDEARAIAEKATLELRTEAGITPEVVIREGDLLPEIRRLLEEDPDIRILVIAAGSGKEGPGPLVSQLAKGSPLGGTRAIPVLVVPGSLSRADIRELALPGEGLEVIQPAGL